MIVDIKLQPKERQLFDLMEAGSHSLIGYGGARGGAKSHAARSVAILRRLIHKGTKALVFRKNYDDLWQNHIMPMMEEQPGLFERYYSAENKALMLPDHSTVLFRYADSLKDVLAFKGKEFGDIFIDEASDMTAEEIAIICSTGRSIKPGFKPQKVLTFNPGGVGHGYVKRVFVDKDLTKEETEQHPAFIQAYAWDNVFWVLSALRADGVTVKEYHAWERERKIEYLITRSDYGKDLNAMPEHLRRPWLFGDWDVFRGQVFDEFRRNIHTCKPFALPDWWRLSMSNDPGFNDPGTWYLHAASQTGTIYIAREWAFMERIAYSEQAKKVRADLKEMGIDPDKIYPKTTGMDAFVVHPETGKSITSYYEAEGLVGWQEPDHGSGCRARMAGVVHEYLKVYDSTPTGIDDVPKKTAKLQIFDTCKYLIRTLPTLPQDENNPEQVADSPDDHGYQGAGYGLQAWHAKKSHEPPVPLFKPGSAGMVLNHAKKLGLKPKKSGVEW